MKTKCVRHRLKKTVTNLKNELILSWKLERCKQTWLFRRFDYNEFRGVVSLSLLSVISKQALNAKLLAIDQVASLLMEGEMKEGCQGADIAKSCLIDASSPERPSNSVP